MFSQTERMLLIQLITDRIAAPENDAQRRLLCKLRAKVAGGSELLTVREIRRALDTAGEADNRRCRWVLYETDIALLTDTLNAIQVRYATARKDIAHARECQTGEHCRSRYL